MTPHICPVCDYAGLDGPPENWQICPQCGTEFGYDDATKTHQQLREEWERGGRQWWSEYEPTRTLALAAGAGD
jgi:transcription initiation factor IIE alpha subunit